MAVAQKKGINHEICIYINKSLKEFETFVSKFSKLCFFGFLLQFTSILEIKSDYFPSSDHAYVI